jgi:hypothetical protein
MPTFNAELACKALEQRLSSLERVVESLRKSANSDDTGAKMKGHEERMTKLEGVVKTMGETRGAPKLEAMEKQLKAMSDAKFLDDKTYKRLQENVEKERDAEYQKRDQKMKQDTQVIVDKQLDEHKKQIDSMKMDTRLQTLEVKLHVLEAKLNSTVKG